MRPILWSRPRHFPSAHIVTMRGRTFRRPLTTTRDGRARGRGGRLPGDESLTCPPVAAAHRRTARRGASAGRPAPAARGTVRDAAAKASAEPTPPDPAPSTSPWTRSAPASPPTATPSPSPARSRTRASRRSRTPMWTCGWARRLTRPRGDRRRRRAHGLPAGRRRRRVGGKYVEKFPELAAGVAQHFTLSVPVKELDLDADGRLPAGRLALRPDRRPAVRPGARHPADLPALAARRARTRRRRPPTSGR